MCLFNCCIFKTLHILFQCQTTVIRARTPDCCYVVLSPTAHIPTYRQPPLPIGAKCFRCDVLKTFAGVPLPSPTTLVGQRCHWRHYHQNTICLSVQFSPDTISQSPNVQSNNTIHSVKLCSIVPLF